MDNTDELDNIVSSGLLTFLSCSLDDCSMTRWRADIWSCIAFTSSASGLRVCVHVCVWVYERVVGGGQEYNNPTHE